MSTASRFDPKLCERLFHGTIEPLIGRLRTGYDKLFWTAESSAVAQNYIPKTGSCVRVTVNTSDLDRSVWPIKRDPIYALAKTLGPAPVDVQWDVFSRASSWSVPKGYPTYRQVVDHIENVLGYKNISESYDRHYELLTDGWDAKEEQHKFVAADFKKEGSLVIIEGIQSLRFFDISRGDSDLMELQYNDFEAARRARLDGFDGIVIDDFAQSKTWGNVGHRAIGLFNHAIDKISTTIIPASNFDWGPERENISVVDSPEFLNWQRARNAQLVVGEGRAAPDPVARSMSPSL